MLGFYLDLRCAKRNEFGPDMFLFFDIYNEIMQIGGEMQARSNFRSSGLGRFGDGFLELVVAWCIF